MHNIDKFNNSTMTVEELATILHVGRSKAYQIVSSKLFPSKKLGHTIRIPVEPFFNWLNKGIDKGA